MGHTRRENDVTYRDFGRRWQMTHQTTQIFLPERTSFLAQSEGLQGTTAHSKSIFICLAFFTPIRNFAAAAQTRVHWLPANCGGHQCRQGKDNRMLQTIRQLTAAALYSLLLFFFLHGSTTTVMRDRPICAIVRWRCAIEWSIVGTGISRTGEVLLSVDLVKYWLTFRGDD